MNVNLNDDAMKQLVAKAIFDGLGEEQRQALVQEAISSLLNDKANSRDYNSPTVIQSLFNSAVANAAGQIVRERIKTDEVFQAQLNQLFSDVARAFFKAGTDDYNGVVEKMAGQMASAFTRDRY